MTLADILDIVFKRIKILVIIPIVFFAASMFYGFEMVAPTYTATTTFMVLNQTYYDSITYNDLMIGEVLISDYQFLAKTSTVYRKAAEDIQQDVSDCSVSISGVDNTRMVRLSVTSKRPEVAANFANALTEELTQRISEIMKIENITIVEPATVPYAPSGPNKTKIVLTATFVGVVMAAGIVLLLEFMDNTIQSSDDIEKHLGIPVLAQINKLEDGGSGR